jgi:hypothetical protein
MISSEFLSEHGLIIEQEIIEAVTSLCSALFSQSSLELVVMGWRIVLSWLTSFRSSLESQVYVSLFTATLRN